MTNRDPVRDQIIAVIDGGHAHMTFDEAVADFPPGHFNTEAPNVPYSFWHILEHIRRTARDILDYIQDPAYRSRTWPDDYWPRREEQADEPAWDATLRGIRTDMASLRAIMVDPDSDLHAPVRNAHGHADHTLLREVCTVIDHNAYHIGEFAILRQVVGTWPVDRDGI